MFYIKRDYRARVKFAVCFLFNISFMILTNPALFVIVCILHTMLQELVNFFFSSKVILLHSINLLKVLNKSSFHAALIQNDERN